jgi:hypothetical protein
MTVKITFIIEDEGNGVATTRSVDTSDDAKNTEKLMTTVLMSVTELVLGRLA